MCMCRLYKTDSKGRAALRTDTISDRENYADILDVSPARYISSSNGSSTG